MRSIISTLTLAGVIGLVGCGKKSGEKQELTGPVTVSFGDCAGPAAYFESGPQPAPFDADDVDHRMAALASAKEAAAKKPVALEEEPLEESLELEEGRMGKEDSEREAGKYALEGAGDGAFTSITGTADFSSELDDRTVYGGIVGDEVGEMKGGFGFGVRGYGPAGGGTGWGTIGAGRYGTIGHGSNTGSGYGTGSGSGGMRDRQSVTPQVRIGSPTVDGDLDKNIIRRFLRRKLPRIRYCYEKQLLVKPGLRGTVVTSFVIEPDGSVAKAAASGVSEPVSSCIKQVISSIEFPKPKSGVVNVRYPFNFRPGSGEEKAEPLPASPPAPEPAPAEPEPKKPPPRTAEKTYQAGKDNPLRSHRDALEECIRKQSRRYGAFVVELEVEAGGSVKAAKTLGTSDEGLTACVAKVAREASWKQAQAQTYRCPVSFGPMPVADLPGVDITADQISYTAGSGAKARVVDETQRIVKDTTPEWKLVELFEILRQQQQLKQTELPAEVVSITGPAIIRPVAATPMKVLSRVLKTMSAAEVHAVLGAKGDGGWRIVPHANGLASDALPVAPVPLGTGDVWYAAARRVGFSAYVDELPVVKMSILITEDEIWVGLSMGNGFTKVPKEGTAHNLALLEETLAKHAADLLAGRNDVEIGAEDAVVYRDVVTVIAAVVASGFDDWALADPAALTARPQL